MTQPRLMGFTIDENKDPWLAVNLSALWPGMGQCYLGKPWLGARFAITQATLVAIVGWSILSARGNTLLGLCFLLPSAFLYLANLFEVYRDLTGVSLLAAGQALKRGKNPWFAVFLCQLLPGLGQLYLEQNCLGFGLMVGSILLGAITIMVPKLVVALAALSALACYHAYRSSSSSRSWRQDLKYLLLVITIVFCCRFVFSALPIWLSQTIQPFRIPSESMLPTLRVGDRILVRKSDHYQPKVGDVIVFQSSDTNIQTGITSQKFFVKRVVGQPGQIVEISNGQVYLNHQLIQENYISEPPDYQWGPKQVPIDHCFVLGDNRNDSFDSHIWGFLSSAKIVGKAYKVFWPTNRIKPL